MPDSPAPKPARADAARRNGARSRGPITAEGKRRASMNAVRHSLAAETLTVLPGEDPAALAALLDALAQEHAPTTATEAFLVRRLASAMWRLQRVEALEAELLTTREQRHDAAFLSGYNPNSPALWDASRLTALGRHEARLERTVQRCLQELRDLRTHAPALPAADEALPNEPERAVAAPATPPSGPEAAVAAPTVAPNEPEAAAAPRVVASPYVPPRHLSKRRGEPLDRFELLDAIEDRDMKVIHALAKETGLLAKLAASTALSGGRLRP